MAAASGGDWESAEAHFARALELAESLPHRVDQVRVRAWHARMLLDRSAAEHRERAHALLDEARPLAVTLGMHGQVDWIDELRTL